MYEAISNPPKGKGKEKEKDDMLALERPSQTSEWAGKHINLFEDLEQVWSTPLLIPKKLA